MASCNANTVTHENGDRYLRVNSNAALINATKAFINWRPVTGAEEMEAPLHQAISLLLYGCKADFINDETHPMTFNITDEAWTDIIDTLTLHKVFASKQCDRIQFREHILKHTSMIEDGAITISDEHLREEDPFDEPSPEEEGEEAGSDINAEEGPEELRFLSLTPVKSLIPDEGPQMALICDLAGALGACTNKQRRISPSSDVRIMSAILLPALHKFMGFTMGTLSDVVLATQVKQLLMAARMDSIMQSTSADIATLRNEWVDSFRCHLSTHLSAESRNSEKTRTPEMREPLPHARAALGAGRDPRPSVPYHPVPRVLAHEPNPKAPRRPEIPPCCYEVYVPTP